MKSGQSRERHFRQAGFSLIEVLIALVVVSIALLGMANVQTQAMRTEIDIYQKAQAMTLLEDIASRVNVNRPARGCYATSIDGSAYTLGTETEYIPECLDYGDAGSQTVAADDLINWDDLLDGATEEFAGQSVGTLTGARGCIDYDEVSDQITITIAWQGEIPTSAPANDCGEGAFGDERLRRTIGQTIRFAKLD